MDSPKSKLSLGISLIVLGLILVLGRSLPSQAIDNSFINEPVQVQGFQEGAYSYENSPQRIIIPSVSVDIEVKNAKIVKGYWEVFSDSAGWGEGSGLPGQAGNQVIFAHARKGLFLPLKNIGLGAKIYVLAPNGWFSYDVKEIKEVYPNQIEVIKPTEDETLTLYTCSGFNDAKRLIVTAKRS
jgi:LPXTG-site transpeptidase (sortase) family protein